MSTTTTYLIPVIAIAPGAIFRDEIIHPIAIVGVLIVLSGGWIATRALRVGH